MNAQRPQTLDRKTRVVIVSGDHAEAALVLMAAEALGMAGFRDIHVLTAPPAPLRLRMSRWVTRCHTMSSTEQADTTALAAAIKSITASTPQSVALPAGTHDVLQAAEYRTLLEPDTRVVATPDPTLTRLVSSKSTFVECANENGLPTPASINGAPGITTESIINTVGLPLVYKPVSSTASRGVSKINTASELDALMAQQSPEQGVFQTYHDGEDVAATLLVSRHGHVMASVFRRKYYTPPGWSPFATGVNTTLTQCDWLETSIRDFISRTGFVGIADFDLRVHVDKQDAVFLEMDPRLMGGIQVFDIFGMNVPLLLIEDAFGYRTPDQPCVRPQQGHFITSTAYIPWLFSRTRRSPRIGPVRTNIRRMLSDPLALLARVCTRLAPRQESPAANSVT